ncbi:MAG: ABC transporter ATP-binding protein [Mesorhizobium sp.]|nr:ABC transporter ATP-binding protein [Mesorhizobium sp.]MBL8580367.1 ABC transporter ATP-binding protein [Mesorhizobium sp.]
MALELVGIRKNYDRLEVLPPLDLSIVDGEFLTLLGPSGSGKTTVLRIIGGFARPSGGQLMFDETDITDLPANRRPFNTVFQDYALFPHMTVRDNVGYGPLVQRRDPARSARLVSETLAIVGLAAMEQRYPSQLSGGQRQRVALARAIVCEPKVILLDEPLAALDASLRRQMQLFLKDIQRQIKTTFVFVTHDQEEAITMSDRIAVMNGGRIEQLGSPRDLYFQPKTKFVATFFGDNNIVEGVLAPGAGEVDTPLGRLPIDRRGMPAIEGRCIVAVRPERMRIGGENGAAIAGQVAEVVFSGPMTRILVAPAAAPELRLDVRLSSDAGQPPPQVGERVTVVFDPSDAVVVPG